MTQAASPSETWVTLYQTTQFNNPEDSHLRVADLVPSPKQVARFVAIFALGA
jgi:hypothetical protein